MIFNTIAFLASMSIILMLVVSGLHMKRRRWMWIQMGTMWIAITALTCTYFVGLINVTPDNVKCVLYHVTRTSGYVWLVLMGLVFIGNFLRMVLWLLRKYGYVDEKPKDGTDYVDDDENDEL